MRPVRVNIESLVLNGFRYEDRHALAQGLQEQLAKLLSEPGMAERLGGLGNISRLDVAPVVTAQDATPRQVGSHVAGGIGKGMSP